MKRLGESGTSAPRRPPNPLAGVQRVHRRSQVLGDAALCVRCGQRAPSALRRVPAGLFEDHHPLGRQHEPDLTVVVCATCHAILSAAQLDDDVQLRELPTTLERLVAITGAWGSYHRELGEALLAWADRGRTIIDGLDRDFSDWRKKPWAK